MHATTDYDSLSLFDLLKITVKSCNDQQVCCVARHCLAELLALEPHFLLRVVFKFKKVSLHVTKGVGVAVSEVHSVIIVGELAAECQRKIVALRLFLHTVLIVADVLASTDPPFTEFFSLNCAVHQWPHAMVVQTIRLQEIYDIESIGTACHCVADSEIVPLCEASCIVVGLKNQIVFEFVHLNRSAQISRLKSALKDQCVVVLEGLLVVGSQDLVVIVVVRIFVHFGLARDGLRKVGIFVCVWS